MSKIIFYVLICNCTGIKLGTYLIQVLAYLIVYKSRIARGPSGSLKMK